MTAMAFEDRRGNVHYPKHDSVVRPREGVFSCCVYRERILLICPEDAPDVPELPGGGIESGETVFEANKREFEEETGFIFPFHLGEEKSLCNQLVHFYADDVDEYWEYAQSFFLYEAELGHLYFEGTRQTPEKGIMRWVPFDEIDSLSLLVMHKLALQKFGILKT